MPDDLVADMVVAEYGNAVPQRSGDNGCSIHLIALFPVINKRELFKCQVAPDERHMTRTVRFSSILAILIDFNGYGYSNRGRGEVPTL
jgi:hypothetical protein